jgi:acyl phosphate:glycerol-3-phosphate acyltransferase
MILGLKILAAFLIGAIPFAKVAMLGTGRDITKEGSGNPGFNNVLRVTKNWRRAGVALIGDISKGYLALVLLGRGEVSAMTLWFIGIAAVGGHCWSPFLKFNGGKGVATTVGVLLFLEWQITLACLPLYVVLRFLGRKLHWRQEGAIASLLTMFVISAVVLGLRGIQSGIFAYLMFAIVFVRHMPNLREIVASRHEWLSARSSSV